MYLSVIWVKVKVFMSYEEKKCLKYYILIQLPYYWEFALKNLLLTMKTFVHKNGGYWY